MTKNPKITGLALEDSHHKEVSGEVNDLKHGFQNLNLHRIYLRVFANNVRAIRSYEKAGFVHEGRLRQAEFRQGQYLDVFFMSVLKSEWEE